MSVVEPTESEIRAIIREHAISAGVAASNAWTAVDVPKLISHLDRIRELTDFLQRPAEEAQP